MRILVTGSRNWTQIDVVSGALDDFLADHGGPDLTIVHGDCPTGADALARGWAVSNACFGVKEERYPANWRELGKRAGIIRNNHMVNLGADICLAFIRNNSRGATQCSSHALMRDIFVRFYRDDD